MCTHLLLYLHSRTHEKMLSFQLKYQTEGTVRDRKSRDRCDVTERLTIALIDGDCTSESHVYRKL